MSQGEVHRRDSAVVAIPWGIAWAMVTGSPWRGVLAAIGCGLVGQVLNPDLDLLEAQVPWWAEVLSGLFWLVIAALVSVGWEG